VRRFLAGRPHSSPEYGLAISADRDPDLGARCRGNVRGRQNRRGLAIVGWVIGHHEPIREVEIVLADEALTLAPVDIERPDVVESLPDLSREATPGFHVILEPDGFGVSRLGVQAICDDGSRACLGVVEVTVGPPSKLSLWKAFRFLLSRKRSVEWTVLSPPLEREKVMFGKEGWLFLRRDTNDVIGQQTGRVKLNRRKRQGWSRVLKRRVEAIGRSSAEWECLVIPDKEFVYPEHLPEEVVPASQRPVHDFLRVAEATGAPVTYSLEALQAAKGRGELFSRTDSHWNQRGSFVAYQLLCRCLAQRGLAVPSLTEDTISWSQAMAPGGLGMKLYPQAISATTRANLATHSGALVFDNRIQNHGRVMIFEQRNEDGLSCLVFGESFVQNLLVFLKESFRRIVYVHTSMLVDEIVDLEQPDVVLSVPLERFLVQVPDDDPGLAGLTAAAVGKAKLGTLAPMEQPFLRQIPRLDGAGGTEQLGTMPWKGQVLPRRLR
jgi:alginate O-acetyltransferase complex protein AlgJ